MRIVLLFDEGTSYRDIEEKLRAAPSTVSRWKQRYEKDGVLGLATIHPGQPPQKLTPQLRAKVLERTRQAPPDGSTHWSLRKMAAVIVGGHVADAEEFAIVRMDGEPAKNPFAAPGRVLPYTSRRGEQRPDHNPRSARCSE